MNAVVLLPDRDTLDKKTGKQTKAWSCAFRPEAELFAKTWGARLYQIDVSLSLAARGQKSLQTLVQAHTISGPIQLLAICCHGWIDGIQIGWRRRDLARVAKELAAICTRDLRVVLYCCSTGGTDTGAPGGDGGFADSLRDALCKAEVADCQVDAHEMPGHCTQNPRVRRFRGQGSPVGGQGGQWIVEPGKAPLWAAWTKGLKTDLRFRYPALLTGEIHAELMDQRTKAA